METTIIGYILGGLRGIMENTMETIIIEYIWGFMGDNENNMETTF